MRILSVIVIGLLFLTGCVSTQNKNIVKDDPYYAPIYPEGQAEQIVATGSLFNSNFSNDLYFEESLIVKKLDRKNDFYNKKGGLKVVFEVTLGEFDNTIHSLDKIDVHFNLRMPKSFLGMMMKDWRKHSGDKKKRKELIERFKIQIESQMGIFRNKFIIPPWDGDLGRLISIDLMDQLAEYQGEYFSDRTHKNVEIPIEFRYGVFALKYIHYRYRFKDNS